MLHASYGCGVVSLRLTTPLCDGELIQIACSNRPAKRAESGRNQDQVNRNRIRRIIRALCDRSLDGAQERLRQAQGIQNA